MPVVVDGLDQVQAGLTRLTAELQDPADADADAARIIAAAVNPPRHTGRLAASVQVLPGAGARVGTDVPYARINEARNHWMRRAVDVTAPQILAVYTAHIARACETV